MIHFMLVSATIFYGNAGFLAPFITYNHRQRESTYLHTSEEYSVRLILLPAGIMGLDIRRLTNRWEKVRHWQSTIPDTDTPPHGHPSTMQPKRQLNLYRDTPNLDSNRRVLFLLCDYLIWSSICQKRVCPSLSCITALDQTSPFSGVVGAVVLVVRQFVIVSNGEYGLPIQ